MNILKKNQIKDFVTNGFCCIKTSETPIISSWIDLAEHIHRLPKEALKSIDVNDSYGLRGYSGINNIIHNQDTFQPEINRKYFGFDFGFELDKFEKSDVEKILYAKNLWPSKNFEFKESCLKLLNQWNWLAIKIFSEITNLPHSKIIKHFSLPTGNMRFLEYRNNNSPTPLIPPHRDYEFLTIIQSNNRGLEIKNSNGDFSKIPSLPDEIVLLAGDCLEYFSGGKIKALEHRVVCSEDRFSCVYFLCCNSDIFIDKKNNFHSSIEANNITDIFSPSEHVAIMHLSNHSRIRTKYSNSNLIGKIPKNGKNPFLN